MIEASGSSFGATEEDGDDAGVNTKADHFILDTVRMDRRDWIQFVCFLCLLYKHVQARSSN